MPEFSSINACSLFARVTSHESASTHVATSHFSAADNRVPGTMCDPMGEDPSHGRDDED